MSSPYDLIGRTLTATKHWYLLVDRHFPSRKSNQSVSLTSSSDGSWSQWYKVHGAQNIRYHQRVIGMNERKCKKWGPGLFMNKSNFYQRVMLWLPQKSGLFWICPANYFINNYRKIMNFETLFTWLQKLWSNEICNELVSEFLELLNTPPYLKSSMLALCTLDQQQCNASNVLLPGFLDLDFSR